MRKRPNTSVLVTEEDQHLFAQAVADATALSPRTKRVLHAQPITPAAIRARRIARAEQSHTADTIAQAYRLSDSVLDADQSPPDHYRSPGVSTDVLRKLKRGYWPVFASLDLHGMTVEVARTRLSSFISQSVAQNWRCVRVVHGQGLGSAMGHARLKQNSRHWLSHIPEVRAFIQAPNHHGGAGAVLILLSAADR